MLTSDLRSCGTNAGYFRHYRRGQTPCDKCKAAHSAKTLETLDKGRQRAHGRARGKAISHLIAAHQGEYCAYLAEAKADEGIGDA